MVQKAQPEVVRCKACHRNVDLVMLVKYCRSCLVQMTLAMQAMRGRKVPVVYSFEIVDYDYKPKRKTTPYYERTGYGQVDL